MKDRIIEIDQLKGLSIFMVVMRHIAVFCLKGEGYELNEFQIILANVRLPLFFFLSGFVLKKVAMPMSSFPTFVWRKAERLLLPMISVGLIFTFTVTHGGFYDLFCVPFKNSYWYLWVIFLYCVILFFFNKLSALAKKHNLLFDIFLSLVISAIFIAVDEALLRSNSSSLLALSDALSLSLARKYLILFFFGVVVSKYKLYDILFRHERSFSVALILCMLFAYFRQPLLVVPESHLLIALTSIVWIGYLFFTVLPKEGFIMDKLALLGGRTLEIYVLHYFILFNIHLTQLGRWITESGNSFIEFAITIPLAVAIIVTCLAIGNILRRSKLLGYLLLGRGC